LNNDNHIKGVEYVTRKRKRDCFDIQFGEEYWCCTQERWKSDW